MSFTQFWAAYEQVVRKSRAGSLTAEDYAGTTISLTNPGGIGTNHSVPRLMTGQSAIIGVGALEYPAEFQGASGQTLAELGISKIITLTSTYDHRVIQGAESGEFLKRVHQLLLGEDGFYDDIFTSLRLPYEPVRWVTDLDQGRVGNVDRTSRVLEIIDAYRTRGHLMADTDPLNYRQRRHPDLDIITHGLTLWDLDREFPVGGFNGQQFMKLRDVLGVLRDAYCRTVGVEYMHILDPGQRDWIQQRVEIRRDKAHRRRAELHPRPAEQRRSIRNLPADQIHRAETVLPGRRRNRHRPAGRGAGQGHRIRHRRGRHRDGPPRPAQRAGQHRRQALLADLPRVRGQHGPPANPGLRRREIPPGRRRQIHPAVRCRAPWMSPWSRTRPTWRSSTPSWKASPGPNRTSSTSANRATPCCPSPSTATPRSPGRAWSPKPCNCPSSAGTAPAAPCT